MHVRLRLLAVRHALRLELRAALPQLRHSRAQRNALPRHPIARALTVLELLAQCTQLAKALPEPCLKLVHRDVPTVLRLLLHPALYRRRCCLWRWSR